MAESLDLLLFAGCGKDGSKLSNVVVMFLVLCFVHHLVAQVDSCETEVGPRMKLFEGRVG